MGILMIATVTMSTAEVENLDAVGRKVAPQATKAVTCLMARHLHMNAAHVELMAH